MSIRYFTSTCFKSKMVPDLQSRAQAPISRLCSEADVSHFAYISPVVGTRLLRDNQDLILR